MYIYILYKIYLIYKPIYRGDICIYMYVGKNIIFESMVNDLSWDLHPSRGELYKIILSYYYDSLLFVPISKQMYCHVFSNILSYFLVHVFFIIYKQSSFMDIGSEKNELHIWIEKYIS